MKVVISAGGTGGHIYPALAIINKIKEMEPNSEFLYIGTHNRMEKDIIPKYGIPFKSIEIYGFNRKNLFKNFKTINCLIKAKKECKKIIKEFKRRAKHQGILSLDYETTDKNGVRATLADFIVGDEDVSYVDLSVDLTKLNEKERKIYELLIKGVEPLEVAKRLNITHQYVSLTKRKIRLLRQQETRKG